MPIQVRHELKYYISQSQYQVLSRVIGSVLHPIPTPTKTTNTTSARCILTRYLTMRCTTK